MGSALAVRTAVLFLLRIGMAGAANSMLSVETGGFRVRAKCRKQDCNRQGLSALTLRRRCNPELQAADLG